MHRALCGAQAAADTDRRIDKMLLFPFPRNTGDRTINLALSAADAAVENNIRHQLLADARRAALIPDMRNVFIPEIFQRGQNRIRRRLTQAAERRIADHLAELLKPCQVAHLAFPCDKLFQHLQNALVPDSAGGTFPTGFLDGKIHEKARNIDHAVGFVHDDKPARSHNRADRRQRFEIDVRRRDQLRRDTAAGGPAGLNRFNPAIVPDPFAFPISQALEYSSLAFLWSCFTS